MAISIDRTKLLAIIAVVIVVVAGITIAVMPKGNNDSPKTVTKTVDKDLGSMTWEEILEEAQGQTVNLGLKPSDKAKRFYDGWFSGYLKENYGIIINMGTQNGLKCSAADYDAMTSGGAPKYDMYWLGVSGYGAYIDKIYWTDDWKAPLPDAKTYLQDGTDAQISYLLYGDSSKYVGNEIEFTGGQLAYCYNYNLEDPTIGYDKVKLTYGNAVKTVTLSATGSDTLAWDSAETGTYKSTAVTTFLKGLSKDSYTVKYGLPTNYTELFEWMKIWPGQFTYCDPQPTSSSYYIGYSFIYGALYELKWETEPTSTAAGSGWTDVGNHDAITARAVTIDNRLAEIYTNAKGDQTEFLKAFNSEFGYIYEYLSDIEPYITQKDSKAWYPAKSDDVTSMMIGYADGESIPQNGTVMLTYYARSSMYPDLAAGSTQFETGLYQMKTSIKEQYCWTINKDSKSKAACMVICNACCLPEVQAKRAELTGETINLDFDKWATTLGGKDSDSYKTAYAEKFGFIKDVWGTKPYSFVEPSELAGTAVDANPSKYYSLLGADWKDKYL